LARLSRISDSQVREDAAWALVRLGPEAEDAVPPLIAALQDESAKIRECAVDALKGIGPSARPALPSLRLALDDPAIEVRTAAAAALWSLDPKPATAKAILPVLREALGDGKTLFVRDSAIKVLNSMGSEARPALPELIALLQDQKSSERGDTAKASERGDTAKALGSIGPDPRSIQALCAALQDSERAVRYDAAVSLGRIGAGEEKVLRSLTDALQDSSAWVRAGAAASLWKLTGKAELVLTVLIDTLENDKEGGEVISTLGDIGPQAKEAAPALRKALRAQHAWIRVEAAIALAKIGLRDDPEVPQVLESMLASSDYSSRRVEATQALWTFYRQLGPLIELLRQNNYYRGSELAKVLDESEAARVLGEIGPDAREAVPELVKALKHKHLRVRLAARTALKRIDPKAAEKAGVR
jgi:HEAT repeat protein